MGLVLTSLQRYKSDVHPADHIGRPALYYAVHLGYRDANGLETIELPLSAGASPCPQTTTAYLPL
jgi:hypothetical protein